MLCTSCGIDLEARFSKFCPRCGAPLQASNTPTYADATTAVPAQDDDLFALIFPHKTHKASPLPALLVAPPQRRNGLPPVEPFISSSPAESTIQDIREPTLANETFSPVSLEMGDRIVVEPPYPGPASAPMQFMRERIHPAMFGVAFIILVVFLGSFWWWGSKKTDPFPEDASATLPAPPSEPLRNAEPSLPPSAPDSPAEDTLVFTPETGSEQETELMSIPSLPENQRQGRHNSSEINYSPPSPAQPARITNTSAPEPVAKDSDPPWLGQMRKDLLNCQNFYCLESVRDQYCTGQWKNLPECKSTSL